jgi:O-antigen/teichoic acid export membrane protein
MRNSTFKPTLLLISGQILAFAGTFLVPLILVRIFAPAEFGTYKQLFLIYATLYAIAQIGMAESLYYFLPLGPQKSGRYVMNSLLVLMASGLVFLGVIEIAGSRIADWMNNPGLARYMPWIGVYLWLTVSTSVLEITMVAKKRYLWASFTYAFSDLLRAAFFIIPVLIVQHLDWLLMGGVAFAVFRFGVTVFYLRREFGTEFKPDFTLLKKQLAYALPFQTACLVYILQFNFHQYAVSSRFDAATFAIYAVGCLQVPLVDLLFTTTGSVMMVRMGEEIREGRTESVLAIWYDATRKLALFFFPLVGLLLVTAHALIVILYTETYLPSVPIFMIASTEILLSSLLTDAFLRVYAQTRFLFLLNTIRLAMILALIYPFMSAFGFAGALLATIIVDLIGKAIALQKIKGLLKVNFIQLLPWQDFGKIFIVAAAAVLPALMIGWKMNLSTFNFLAVTSLVYTASYLAMVFGLGLLTDNEKFEIMRLFQKLIARAVKMVPFKKEVKV